MNSSVWTQEGRDDSDEINDVEGGARADRTGAFERQSVTHLTFLLELQTLEWQVAFCICISGIHLKLTAWFPHSSSSFNRLQSVRKNTAHGYIRVAETLVAFLRMQKVFFSVIYTTVTKIKPSVGCYKRRLKLTYFTKPVNSNCSNLGLCNEKRGYNRIISTTAKYCCLLLNFSLVDCVTKPCGRKAAGLSQLFILPACYYLCCRPRDETTLTPITPLWHLHTGQGGTGPALNQVV